MKVISLLPIRVHGAGISIEMIVYETQGIESISVLISSWVSVQGDKVREQRGALWDKPVFVLESVGRCMWNAYNVLAGRFLSKTTAVQYQCIRWGPSDGPP